MQSPANCHRERTTIKLTPPSFTFLMKLTPLTFLNGKFSIFLISFKPNLKLDQNRLNQYEFDGTPGGGGLCNKESIKGGYLMQMIEEYMSNDS